MRYLFILGNASDLSKAEIAAVFKFYQTSSTEVYYQPPILILDVSREVNFSELINRLGGTIKIAQIIKAVDPTDYNQIFDCIDRENKKTVDFGFSVYGKGVINLSKLVGELKNLFVQKHISSRYILPKNGSDLSSVVLQKQKIQEYILFYDGKNWLIAKTLAYQNADMWSKRDVGRPFITPSIGMLPLKVSRMMVNLALSYFLDKKTTILDPFCGMGTILGDALMMGQNIIGSDIGKDIVNKAQKNIEWLVDAYQISGLKYSFIQADATHLSQKIPQNSVDVIITEPFMGALFETRDNALYLKGKRVNQEVVKNTIKGLEKLYLGVFKDWRNILNSNGIVVITLPEINFERKRFFVKKLVDSCEKLGYTLSQGPYTYSRSQAIVKRQIYVFVKKQAISDK